ncbi:MAG: hypothetical protein LAO06_01785 [Acidobacteriia bacterium]|nr:hypothetical protein [Terriglobia bacterium]
MIVGISATAVDLAVISYNREVPIHQLIGDFIATLVAVLVCRCSFTGAGPPCCGLREL